MKKCEYEPCGVMFEPERSTARFHSDACRVAFNRSQKGAKVSVTPIPKPSSVSFLPEGESIGTPFPIALHEPIHIPLQSTEDVDFPEPKITDLSKHPLNTMKKVIPKKVSKKPAKEQDIYDAVAEHRRNNGMDPVTGNPATPPKPKKVSSSKPSSTTPAIEKAMAEINKDYGEGSVIFMGDDYKVKVDVIPTGNLAIDHALGVGGVPRGRIVEVYGPASAGKSTLATSIVAQAQSMGLRAAYIDVEHAFDPDYARQLGVNIASLAFSQPDSGVEALRTCQKLIATNSFGVIVVDSVAALISEQEKNGEIGDAVVGAQARLMSQSLRILSPIISKSNTCCVFINQIREKIGVMFGPTETTSGGRALKFYASVRIDIRAIQAIKDALGENIGSRTKVTIVKNKVAPPHRKAEFDLIIGEGVAGVGSLIDLGVQMGVIEKKGSWYSHAGQRIGQGRDGCKLTLKEDPALRQEIEGKVRSAMTAPTTPVVQSTESPTVEEDDDNIP